MILLQTLPNATNWSHGNWHHEMFGVTTNLIGEAQFGVIVGGMLIIGYFVAGDGDLATPTVLLILMSALLFPLLPSGFSGVAWSLAFMGMVSGLLAISRKYVLED